MTEGFYKAIFEHLVVPTCIIKSNHPHYTIVDCNQLYKVVTNTIGKEIIGKGAWEVFDPEGENSATNSFIQATLRRAADDFRAIRLPAVRFDIPNELGKTTERWWETEITPFRDGVDECTYLMVVSKDITSNVFANAELSETQQREQELNEELAAMNEELNVTNEELLASNNDLIEWQKKLETANRELDEQVKERTNALLTAQQQAELERDSIKRFFMDAPAAICILSGADMVFEFVNPKYQQFFPERGLVGKSLGEALPELKDNPIIDILTNVYSTGQPFEGKELAVPFAKNESGEMEDRYFNFIYQPRYNINAEVDGIMVFAFEVTDLVLSRKRVEESEHDLRNLVMTSHYALLVLRGREWTAEIANKGIAAMWEKPLENIIGRKLLDILPELEDQPFPKLLTQVYNSGVSYGQEEEVFYLDTPEGQVKKYVSFYYDPLLDLDGKVSGIIVTASDVTNIVQSRELVKESYQQQQNLNEELAATNEELSSVNEELTSLNEELSETQNDLKNSLKELALSETRFRKLVQQAPVAIGISTGTNFVIEAANDAMLKLLGKDASIIGKPSLVAMPEIEGQPFLAILEKVYSTGVPYYGNEAPVLVEKDGELKEYYFNFIYQPIVDENGNTTSIINVAIDVTDQVLSRKQVKESEDNFRMLADNISQLSWITDADGWIVWYNQRWFDFTGTTLEEMQGWGWKAVHHPDFIDSIVEKWSRHLKRGEVWEDTFPLRSKTGEYRWFLSRAVPLKDADGNVLKWFGTNTDITEQRQLVQLKDDFISIASHELKTPITSLKASIQLLDKIKDRPTEKIIPTLITQARKSLDKVSILIDDLLNASKINNGHIHLKSTNFLVAEMAENAVEHLLTEGSHQIEIKGDLKLNCYADRDRIAQVVTNFVNNAVKYAPNSKIILNIGTEADGQSVRVSVTDFGPGIPSDKLAHLFERYFRVDNSGIQYSGLGLGLYICSEIIDKHNGKIGVESEIGKGSTFWFTIPIKP